MYKYQMYETEMMTHNNTGFSLYGETAQDVLNQLEAESFTVKYYVLHTPTGIINIENKKDLKQWFLDETGEV